MSSILNGAILNYLDDLLAEEDPFLHEMEDTARTLRFPRVDRTVGQFLSLLTKISGARRILELGSGFGYSAYYFARALPDGGKVICTDYSPAYREMTEDLFSRAGMSARLEYHCGNAVETIETLSGEFDIVFNDLDKYYYDSVLEKAVSLLRTGGIFLSDNALWKGKVADRSAQDPSSRAVRSLISAAMNHPLLETTLLTIGDGLLLSRKTTRSPGAP